MKTWEDLIKHSSALVDSMKELFQRHDRLLSFSDAREWDKDAQAIIDLMTDFVNDSKEVSQTQTKGLERLNQKRNDKPFLKRVFSSQSSQTKLKELIGLIDSTIERSEGIIQAIYEKMDKTPADKAEQKQIVDELKQLKKELTLQKREANEQVKQARVTARQKQAGWAGVNSGTLGKVARFQRNSARLAKERALVPMENLKVVIERQLITIERDINWVTHFTSSELDPKNETSEIEDMRRCKYCGRRISIDVSDICPGCGAAV